MAEAKAGVAILGIFVADTAFMASRLPAIGETIIGSGFAIGPGGKGSNQSVAAARAGAKTAFISKIGDDTFGAMALATWKAEGVEPRVVMSKSDATGAAFIFVNPATGENAIIVYPGAAGTISPANAEAIRSAKVFVTQLEQPVDAAERVSPSLAPPASPPSSTPRRPRPSRHRSTLFAITLSPTKPRRQRSPASLRDRRMMHAGRATCCSTAAPGAR
jgi:ribokinase